MNHAEATDLNTLLRFVLHLPTRADRDVDDTELSEEAYCAAERLVEKAQDQLGAGLTIGDLENHWQTVELGRFPQRYVTNGGGR